MKLLHPILIIIWSSAFGLRYSRRRAWGGQFIRPIRAINIQSWQHPTHFYDPFEGRLGVYRPTMLGCLRGNYGEGCSICKPRLFMMFQRIGNRQVAVCKHTCPIGYVGVRLLNSNKCLRCRVNYCLSCFTRDYCTKCLPGYFLYKGKCVDTCPDGLFSTIITQHCERQVDCVVGEWSGWNNCLVRHNNVISCKRNKKRRTRKVLQLPSSGGEQCPKLKQRKLCRYSLPKCSANNRRKDRRRKRIKNSYEVSNENYDVITKNSVD